MTKWELARYLIDAKKCVDSIMYIAENREELKHINIREKISEKRRVFYINGCVILDEAFPRKKKDLCLKDTIIKCFYYERDKNCAHKDSNYNPKQYFSLSEMSIDLQKQLSHIKEMCKEALPDVITLDFVPHDRELFRIVNGLTLEKENTINDRKYPLRKNCVGEQQTGKLIRILDGIEDIRGIDKSELKNYAVYVENGINDYEGIQNRQDFCIKANVLYGTDMWNGVNLESQMRLEVVRKLGILDAYNVLHLEELSDPYIRERLDKLMETDETVCNEK